MNFENYPNNNQIFYEPKNASKAIYFQNQNESPNTMYYNAYNNNANFNYPIDYSTYENNINYIYQIPKSKTKTRKYDKTKKKVKFNENVDVILIKSFKKYNRLENFSLYDYFDEINNNYNKKKKNGKCECNIF